MKSRRIALLLALILILSAFGATGALAANLPYELSLSKTLSKQKEKISLYDYETDSAKESEVEIVLVSDGAELSVKASDDIGATVSIWVESNGVYTEEGPVYWKVNGSTSGLNYIEKGTTATATLPYDAEFNTLYEFNVRDAGFERSVFIKVQPGQSAEQNGAGQTEGAQPANPETVAPVEQVKATAKPTPSSVLVNGKSVDFESYNIDGSNYFKLRDIAAAVHKSEKQFEVGWDAANNAIKLESGKGYTMAGGELEKSAKAGNQQAVSTSSRIYLDGKEVQLTAYNIAGSNYFKLRDLAKALNIGITWDSKTNTIGIDTSIDYQD